MSNALYKLTLVLLCAQLLAGCAASRPPTTATPEPTPLRVVTLGDWQTADPTVGRALFEQRIIAGGPGCITCHALEPNIVLVGPSLYGVAEIAGRRAAGVAAPDYLFQSLVEPNQHIVDGFTPDVMPTTYGVDLHTDELTNLVSFLMTLQPNE